MVFSQLISSIDPRMKHAYGHFMIVTSSSRILFSFSPVSSSLVSSSPLVLCPPVLSCPPVIPSPPVSTLLVFPSSFLLFSSPLLPFLSHHSSSHLCYPTLSWAPFLPTPILSCQLFSLYHTIFSLFIWLHLIIPSIPTLLPLYISVHLHLSWKDPCTAQHIGPSPFQWSGRFSRLKCPSRSLQFTTVSFSSSHWHRQLFCWTWLCSLVFCLLHMELLTP